MENLYDAEHRSLQKKKNTFSRINSKKRLFVLVFGIVGFAVPMLYGYVNGFPVPHVHDELSYLLAADTYASGRLTNPTPAFFEHFEAPHILVEPSYMSKYPPMQGLFMAAGQFFFGHPIFGVWLSCGAAAAALFWMLSIWTNGKWAFLGTLLMILFIGINGYWAQSYWGGMAAATGGALFFGGFRQLFKKLSGGTTLLMILGGIVLVNARPFEGTATMVPSLIVLLIWLVRDRKNSISRKFSQVIAPAVLLTGIALSAMAYNNYRITGSAAKFAYTAHQAQYHPTALFIFQSPYESATKGTPRLRKLYEYLSTSAPLRNLDSFGLPDTVYLYPLYGFVCLLFLLPFFLLSPPLMIFLFVMTFPLIRRSRWLALIAGTILFTLFCMSFAAFWDNYHYSASLTGCIFLLTVAGLRQIIVYSRKNSQMKIAYALLLLLVTASFIHQMIYLPTASSMPDSSAMNDLENVNLKLDQLTELPANIKITDLKTEIERMVEKLPDKYIALVTYDKNFTFHDEIIYNKADIANSKIIWATDLGEEKNTGLLNFYNNRKIIKIEIANKTILHPVN